jgi:hypothetical protein
MSVIDDQFENDTCYVPTSMAIGGLLTGATVAGYIIEQNNKAQAEQDSQNAATQGVAKCSPQSCSGKVKSSSSSPG